VANLQHHACFDVPFASLNLSRSFAVYQRIYVGSDHRRLQLVWFGWSCSTLTPCSGIYHHCCQRSMSKTSGQPAFRSVGSDGTAEEMNSRLQLRCNLPLTTATTCFHHIRTSGGADAEVEEPVQVHPTKAVAYCLELPGGLGELGSSGGQLPCACAASSKRRLQRSIPCQWVHVHQME
jgi:hypothetical protein